MASRKWTFGKNPVEEQKDEDLETILVFGYGCKLYRDDEKSMYIEDGHHLIPWMSDRSLMIDRYDGRGHLYDLSRHDAEQIRANGWMSKLTEEEKQIEALCDEERYLELHTDIQEKALYEEEELKRLSEALNDTGSDNYAAVGFSYEQQYDPEQPTPDEMAEEAEEEEDTRLYEPPPELRVPEGMDIPRTVKLNAIMMKTASFISSHGTQMEIMIKTKQAENPQFDFLHFDDPLNTYYKHVVKMIKQGKYRPVLEQPDENRRRSAEDEHYLHPSLANIPESPSSENFLDSVQSKLPPGQIASTMYAKLVSNIGRVTGRSSPLNSLPNLSSISTLGTTTKAAASKLGVSVQSSDAEDSVVAVQGCEVGPIGRSNLPPVPGTEPVRLPSPPVTDPHLETGVSAATAAEPPPPGTAPVVTEPTAPDKSATVKPSIAPSSLPIVPPPPDLQPIVDKMAMYVARNGIEFEIVVRSKTDSRFNFIHQWHQYYPYYQNKRSLFLEELAEKEKSSSKGQAKAVAFTIKPKESESTSLGQRRALLAESSDDEEQEGHTNGDQGPIKERYEYNHGSASESAPSSDRPQQPQMSAEEAERKQAEERLRDRLSAAARDKLAQTSKEKQIKAERKRKAAMFITLLKGSNTSSSAQIAAGAPHSPSPPIEQLQQEATSDLSESGSDSGSDSDSDASLETPPAVRLSSPLPPAAEEVRPHSPSSVSGASNHSPRRHSRSRSPAPKLRSKSRSPKRSSRRSKTPPSAYLRIRRSPVRRKSRSRSPRHRSKRDSSHLRGLSPHRSKSHHSSSRTSLKSHSPSKSRSSRSSKSKHRRSRSRSKTRSSKKRSRSRSPSRSSKSRSKKKKRSRSRSKTRKSSKSPTKSKSRSHKSSRSKHRRSKSRSRSKSRTSKSPSVARSSKKSSRASSPVSEKKRLSMVTEEIGDTLTPLAKVEDSTLLQSAAACDANGSPSHMDTESENGSITSITSNKHEKPVSMDLLSKVRAMLQAMDENGSSSSNPS